MSFTELVVGALALWQIVEIFHHSELFASWRARFETWDNFFGHLLLCPFCLSPYVGLIVSVVLLALARENVLYGIPVYLFALARAANLGNDLTHHRCRTLRYNQLNPAPSGSDQTKVSISYDPEPFIVGTERDRTEDDVRPVDSGETESHST